MLQGMGDSHEFVPATAEQVATIRSQLGTDEEDIRQAVASLRAWLTMQPHLPDHIDDARIERMYIDCKCSRERVKLALDAYFSLRNKFPEILTNRDPVGPEVSYTMQHLKLVTMPRLTKDLQRVHIMAGVDPDPSAISCVKYAKVLMMQLDMMYLDDCSLGDVVICDLNGVTLGHLLRIDINVVRAVEFCYKTVNRRRMKEIHLLNVDKVTDFVMKIAKTALSEKLLKRIRLHLPGSNTLFDHVQREDVPDELGGTAGPIDTFAYEFIRRAEKLRDWFLEQDKYTSDESKRPADNHYADSIFGVAGSFRKLTVD
ncbi:retinol-binding protein pinta-like [Schistocerca cancellata]|uniref:retinol-binding protein pinta-like n=1 Tax=Schistocerca cancellata TaxID=274614 RepID=UPI002117DA25|nr:retinol-binding protein pinta-like [Schistocerca cancellata]